MKKTSGSRPRPKTFFSLSYIFIALEGLHRILSSIHPLSRAGSFYGFSQRRVGTQLSLWKRELPSIKPYYAVKCNPDAQLITWLAQGGAGFDCASGREITTVKSAAPFAPILYANPCKKEEDILCGSANHIQTTVVDSAEEIEKLKSVRWNGTTLVRLRVSDTESLMPFSNKFGASLDSLPGLIRAAVGANIPITGISFHVGSGCKNPEQFREAIQEAAAGISILRGSPQKHVADTIDIGGGFSADSDVFQSAATVIRREQQRVDATVKGISWVAEPGRFFAAQSQDFFVRVIGKKPAATSGGWRYTLDDSLYGQFSCIPFDHARPRWIRIRAPGEARRPESKGVLFGRTCDSVDYIAGAKKMEELCVGDWLWFPHMGAYTTVTATEFNGFPQPKRIILPSDAGEQLPEPAAFSEEEWPHGCAYVSTVKVPDLA
jgi:ornithine decarboxylase